MLIQITNKDIAETRRLVKCLASGIVPVNDLRDYLDNIRQKIEKPSAVSSGRNTRKEDRKNKYRLKIAS